MRRGGTARTWTRALDHLEAGYLNDQAARLAARALAVPGLLAGERRLDLLLRAARALSLQGRRDGEREILDEALALAVARGEPGPEGRVRAELGWHLERMSRSGEAIEELERAQALALEAGDEATASLARGNLGIALLEDSRFEESRPHLEARLAWLEAHGPPAEVPPATANLALLSWRQGSTAAALAGLERALELAREVGNRRAETAALGNLAILYRHANRLDDAQQAARAAAWSSPGSSATAAATRTRRWRSARSSTVADPTRRHARTTSTPAPCTARSGTCAGRPTRWAISGS